MQTGFYEYSQRKPQPKVYRHTGAADCLCALCLIEYRRLHPEEYAVFQAAPRAGAVTVDLTGGGLSGEMRVVATESASGYSPKVDKSSHIRRPKASRKEQYVKAAVILSL